MDILKAERRSRAIREQEQHVHIALNNEQITRNRVQVCEDRIEALKASFLTCHDRLCALEAQQNAPLWSKVRKMLTFRRNSSKSVTENEA